MRKGGSKQKGSEFERKICERLSRWIDPDSDRSFFWRAAMSGGRATVRRYAGKKTEDQAGDLCSIAPQGNAFLSKFVVECKHVKNLNIPSALFTGTQELATFWRQVSRDAALAQKRPLLIARQNMFPIIVLLRTVDYHVFFDHQGEFELLRLFRLGGRLGSRSSLSMLLLDDLLKSSYEQSRWIIE